jgi:hypothetical protein
MSREQARRTRTNNVPVRGSASVDGLPDTGPYLADELDLGDLTTYVPVPPDWLVEDLIEVGDVVNLAAFWGVGKSWLAQSMAVSIADESREQFLGRTIARHGPVCYFDGESKESSAKNRLKLLGGSSTLSGALHYHLNTGLQLSTTAGRASILSTVAAHQPLLVVFDSLGRFRLGTDENSADEMALLFAEGIQPISRRYGAAVLLLDHVAKDSGKKLDANRAMRGSGEKAAQTDRLWLLKEHTSGQPGKVVLEFGRAKEGPEQTEALVIQRRHEEGRVLLEVASGEDARLAREDPKGVISYLGEHGGSAPQADIVRDIFRGSPSAASKAITKLEDSGDIETAPIQGNRKAKLVSLAAAPEGEMVVAS